MAFDQRDQDNISQINVTPLVDVMLVLLVIFMVTAPILQQGVTVRLPSVKGAALPGEEKALVVSVTAAGLVAVNDKKMPIGQLQAELEKQLGKQPDPQVLLRADTAVAYGE